jgi:uncharacterized protein YcbK (DUF882 family)
LIDRRSAPPAHLSRRRFCRYLGAGIAAAACGPLWTSELAAAPGFRALSFQHTHTGESLAIPYVEGGQYLPEALARIDYVLRDHYDGSVHPIDRDLLDILHAVSLETGTRQPFQVVSGYRSPATNEMLRRRGPGVSKNSLHMQGRAIDIRLGDVSTKMLREAGLKVAGGGVGYYGTADFVHLDTGRVRWWTRP